MCPYVNNGKNELNRLRPLFILKMMMECTDDETFLTTSQILAKLESEYGLVAHRQTIKYDVDTLNQLGYEIEVHKGTRNEYRYAGRIFDTPEIRILIDAVISSKSLSRSKSLKLAKKLTSLAGGCTTYALNKSIDVNQRVKTPNESIYYITDVINQAINFNCKIAFYYFEYNCLKEKKYKNKGRKYIFSPYKMLWDGDFYYMVGYSDKHKKITSFRIDRIDRAPELLEDVDAVPMPEDFDLSEFVNSMPRMLDSSREEVTIEFDNDVASAVFDRFGYDVDVTLLGNCRSSVTVLTAVGPVLYSWIAGFAGRVKLIASEQVLNEYRELLLKALSA